MMGLELRRADFRENFGFLRKRIKMYLAFLCEKNIHANFFAKVQSQNILATTLQLGRSKAAVYREDKWRHILLSRY